MPPTKLSVDVGVFSIRPVFDSAGVFAESTLPPDRVDWLVVDQWPCSYSPSPSGPKHHSIHISDAWDASCNAGCCLDLDFVLAVDPAGDLVVGADLVDHPVVPVVGKVGTQVETEAGRVGIQAEAVADRVGIQAARNYRQLLHKVGTLDAVVVSTHYSSYPIVSKHRYETISYH